ncbi:WD repeat domain-containing protein 2 Leucine-rich repeat and [Collichthys lucidus]|uniref:WD repeat domain-containing protein 2 Leucine-rich repeat and n=1 Tax=Collichthys lucidus TaxID=240159 RepID=A0A4U5VVT3_COLLU|nr:WD repeat domain-containing protein 2 Leucine-rich repeat and [Collichthys lucidus]
MWPSGVGSRQPCPRESALRRAAISGNINALPPHNVPTGRSVRVFICSNPDDTEAERNALKEHVYPKLRDFCRENYGIEFQLQFARVLSASNSNIVAYAAVRAWRGPQSWVQRSLCL